MGKQGTKSFARDFLILRDVAGIASDPKMRKGIFLTNCCGTF